MANEQNLRPIRKGQLSKEELKKRQSNGGIKSGESKRRRKAMKEILSTLLNVQQKNSRGETLTTQEIICLSLINKAAKGDVRAFEVIRDTIGEKPVDKVAQTDGEGNDVPVNDLSKIPTETLLKMAQAAGVGINAADGDVTDRRPD